MTLRIELLNYSEFFPISTLVTDENGKASITLGLGDLHIHALKDGRFITRLVDTRKEPSVEIDFTNASACQTTELDGAEYDVVPPKDNMKFAVRLTDEQKATQQQRFDHAASLLHRKEGTFHTEQSAAQAAQALGLDGVVPNMQPKRSLMQRATPMRYTPSCRMLLILNRCSCVQSCSIS